jgi:protein-disulfide isomerase
MRITGLARRIALAAALLGIGFASTGAAPNWNVTIAQTEGGGHRLGNPDAKVKLMEFVSYTCPHCAHFETDADGPLRIAYIAQGKLSVEVRHIIRDPVDLTAAMLTECGPKEKFFLNHSMILRNQPIWLKKMASLNDAQRNRWMSGNYAARRRVMASDLGFYDLMAKRGYDRVAIDRCLADENFAQLLAKQSAANATDFGVEGTPSFALDGTLLAGTHSWVDLKPQIDARF